MGVVDVRPAWCCGRSPARSSRGRSSSCAAATAAASHHNRIGGADHDQGSHPWVGLDVHAAKVAACVVDALSGEMTVHRLPGTTGEIVSFCAGLPSVGADHGNVEHSRYDVNMKAGTWTGELRARHGLSQAQLAYRAGTSQQAISRIERGVVSPSIVFLERLAAVCGEELVLDAHAREVPFEEAQLAEQAAMPMADRLVLASSCPRPSAARTSTTSPCSSGCAPSVTALPHQSWSTRPDGQ
jgi:transcriptional regulator with XRE-family HTH domain